MFELSSVDKCGVRVGPGKPGRRFIRVRSSQARAQFRAGEIRVLGFTGNVERVIAFNEEDRKL
jgi:hypothetical protein